jgi:hypothetical protein
MALLDRLMREARKSMRARGHEPTTKDNGQAKTDTQANKRVTISCKRCDLTAEVICKPQPNEIQIGGEAVALNCNVATHHKMTTPTPINSLHDEIRMDAVMGC